jgi:hypothetical protein
VQRDKSLDSYELPFKHQTAFVLPQALNSLQPPIMQVSLLDRLQIVQDPMHAKPNAAEIAEAKKVLCYPSLGSVRGNHAPKLAKQPKEQKGYEGAPLRCSSFYISIFASVTRHGTATARLRTAWPPDAAPGP